MELELSIKFSLYIYSNTGSVNKKNVTRQNGRTQLDFGDVKFH